jgi:hypothetical protein
MKKMFFSSLSLCSAHGIRIQRMMPFTDVKAALRMLGMILQKNTASHKEYAGRTRSTRTRKDNV